MNRITPCLVILAMVVHAFAQKGEEKDWNREWLEKDVKYIITADERQVFLSLSTDSEREAFIEQFWLRRDPNPSTSFNEFKEEHYRRIAYANERFKSGVAGWTTDRGRIYIMFGAPDEIRSHVGGHYRRPSYEGGGNTQVFPFEVWRYRHIEGIGSDVEIEFVDPTMTGEFRLAMSPEEKDALLYVSGPGGATWAEQAGLINRGDRILNQYRADPKQPTYTRRLSDMPFERLRQIFQISRPQEIRFKDLQQLVDSKIFYEQIPAQVVSHFVRLNEDELLVPVTLKIEDRYLQFQNELGGNKATVDIYGVISSITGRIMHEFDDTVSTHLNDLRYLEFAQSLYQRQFHLKPGTYKLELVIRDRNSEQIGTLQQGISLPKSNPEILSTSSAILTHRIEPVQDLEQVGGPFVLGAYKLVPRVDRRFRSDERVNLYLEIYSFAVDSAAEQPMLDVRFELKDGKGNVVSHLGQPDFLAWFGDRVIVMKHINLERHHRGSFQMEIQVTDRISRQESSQLVDFEIFEP